MPLSNDGGLVEAIPCFLRALHALCIIRAAFLALFLVSRTALHS